MFWVRPAVYSSLSISSSCRGRPLLFDEAVAPHPFSNHFSGKACARDQYIVHRVGNEWSRYQLQHAQGQSGTEEDGR
jgi:hypothetical protein